MKGYIGIPELIANPLAWILAWFIALFLWFGIPILFFVFLSPLWCPIVATVLYYILFFCISAKTAPWFKRKANELNLHDEN